MKIDAPFSQYNRMLKKNNPMFEPSPDLLKSLTRGLIRLAPDNFTFNMWGGAWIPRLKNLEPPGGTPVGESWEFSTHRDRPNQVVLADGRKISLAKLLEAFPVEIWGERVFRRTGAPAPFLLKFIDSKDN